VAGFDEVYRHSLDDPEDFWAQAAAEIDWIEPGERVLDDSRAPFYHWFAGGRLNSCYNALDRHVARGRADQRALIYDSPVTDTVATYSHRELRDAVARFAGALVAQGVERGDRVVVYMPMVPEAVIAMLARNDAPDRRRRGVHDPGHDRRPAFLGEMHDALREIGYARRHAASVQGG
jgi:propionyl-CoA synthetase